VRAQFDDFLLDSSSRQLTRGGRQVPLSPKAFDVLVLLLAERPNVVTKATLLDRVWADTPAAADANLTVVIADLRRALGDNPQAPRYLRTVHRFGYAFCGDATVDVPAVPASAGDQAPAATRVVLTWGDETRRLGDGEHLIGRDPECAVWLDVPGVSRRHARLRVDGQRVTIEDLASTNGTFIDDVPVNGSQPLLHGQRIHFGPLEVRFRQSSAAVRTVKTVRTPARRRS
jgi:DNA-binding winged helix-turn-helix (wHTH) protein